MPYRVVGSFEAIIPRDKQGLMDGQSDRLDVHEGLVNWWRRAEAIWENHRSSERLTLLLQLDFQSKLEQQFPIQGERIVYNRSGMHLVGARVTER